MWTLLAIRGQETKKVKIMVCVVCVCAHAHVCVYCECVFVCLCLCVYVCLFLRKIHLDKYQYSKKTIFISVRNS